MASDETMKCLCSVIAVVPSDVGTSGDNGASKQANNLVEQKTIELTTSSCE